VNNAVFFQGDTTPKVKYSSTYLSDRYIRSVAARKIPEYVPLSADVNSWGFMQPTNSVFVSNLDGTEAEIVLDTEYRKEANVAGDEVLINVLYFPYWNISVNGETIIPKEYDVIGRPFISLPDKQGKLVVQYRQTPLEKVSNYLTLLTLFVIILVIARKEKSFLYKIVA